MLIPGNCVITTVYACELNKTQIGQQNDGGLWMLCEAVCGVLSGRVYVCVCVCVLKASTFWLWEILMHARTLVSIEKKNVCYVYIYLIDGKIDPVKNYYHNQKSITLKEGERTESYLSQRTPEQKLIAHFLTLQFFFALSLSLSCVLIPFTSQFSQQRLIFFGIWFIHPRFFLHSIFSFIFFVYRSSFLPFFKTIDLFSFVMSSIY